VALLGLLAQSRAEIRLVRRRSQRKERLRSLLLSKAARDFSTLAALVQGLTRGSPRVTVKRLAERATYAGGEHCPAGRLNASGATDPDAELLEA
jgi:hypothetical protein